MGCRGGMRVAGLAVLARALLALTGPLLTLTGPAAAQTAQPVCQPAWSDSEAANTDALQTAIDTCSAKGTAAVPGLVRLGVQGDRRIAQIRAVTLKSNIVLKVEAGFTLLGPLPAEVGYTGIDASTPPLMIQGKGLTNVTITGTGTIDGNGQAYWDIFNRGGDYTNQSRPGKLVDLTGAKLKVGSNFDDLGQPAAIIAYPNPRNDGARALKIRNAPQVHLELESTSSDAIIDGVWITAPVERADLGTGLRKNVAPNTDGIDLVGVNNDLKTFVIVQNCLIDTGDDNIALKSNKANQPLTNVIIRHCVFGGGHGLSIGGQETGGVMNVDVSDVYFNGTDFGLKVKTDNTAKDTGVTQGLTYRNVCMANVAEPIQLTFRYTIATSPGGAAPVIKDVRFDNVVARDAGSVTGQKVLLGEITGLDPGVGPFSPLALVGGNIMITNSALSGPDGVTPFTVTDGALILGTRSAVSVTTGLNGTVTRVADTGPTITCPDRIIIPPQIPPDTRGEAEYTPTWVMEGRRPALR